MIGLYVFFIGALWLAFVVWLTIYITKKLPIDTWRVPVALVLFAMLMPFPLIDEIVGKWQFEKLCKQNSTIHVDQNSALGKTVYFLPQPSQEIQGTWVRVVLQPKNFIDSKTNESVVSYSILQADGGMLVRLFSISEGRVPLIFIGSCHPRENVKDLLKRLNINALDRPQTIEGVKK